MAVEVSRQPVGEHVGRASPQALRNSVWDRLRHAIKHSNKWGYLFILPVVLDFALFTAYTAGRSVLMAFQEVCYGQASWVGLEQFRMSLTDPRFWNAMKNTALFTSSVVPLGIVVGLVLSELVFRRTPKVQVFFKSAYYLPSVVSTVALSMVWIWIYQPYNGVLNYIVGLFGVTPINWLANPRFALPAVIVMSIVGYIGVPVVFTTAAMGGIPTETYDAALIDGAGEWTRFLAITVPLLRPTLLYLFVVGFIGYFQVFEQIYVMTVGGPGYPGATETVGFLIYSYGFRMQNLGRAAAQSILLFLAILFFSVLQVRVFASEIEY